MKLGTVQMWGDDLADFRRHVRLADELGYELIGIGDSPAGWQDLYVSMTLAGLDTKKATVVPMVTSPFLRHPLVTAGALSSLQALTGGRIALGFATGGSTIMAIGHPPATQTEVRAEIAALRALFAGQGTEWDGRPVKPLRHPYKTPIHYSAFGPKALKLAGELCDGVIVFTSPRLEELDSKLEAVRKAAREAGRDPKDVKVWVMTFCSIRETRAQAIEDLKAFIVVGGMNLGRIPGAMDHVPTQFKEKVRELHRRYDPTEHVVVGGRNVKLMDELGLTAFLADLEAVALTPDEAPGFLDGLESRGVDALFLCLPGHANREGAIRALADARKRQKAR